jgi:hypothetical protein
MAGAGMGRGSFSAGAVWALAAETFPSALAGWERIWSDARCVKTPGGMNPFSGNNLVFTVGISASLSGGAVCVG